MKARDGRTKLNELYTVDHNNSRSNEDNAEKIDEPMNDIEGWGEDGTIIKLIDITTTTYEFVTIRVDVDG
jgi:hypothetical protein